MLPLFVSGVFLVGLIVLEKFCQPAERWKSRQEGQDFRKERERWINDGWNVYR